MKKTNPPPKPQPNAVWARCRLGKAGRGRLEAALWRVPGRKGHARCRLTRLWLRGGRRPWRKVNCRGEETETRPSAEDAGRMGVGACPSPFCPGNRRGDSGGGDGGSWSFCEGPVSHPHPTPGVSQSWQWSMCVDRRNSSFQRVALSQSKSGGHGQLDLPCVALV